MGKLQVERWKPVTGMDLSGIRSQSLGARLVRGHGEQHRLFSIAPAKRIRQSSLMSPVVSAYRRRETYRLAPGTTMARFLDRPAFRVVREIVEACERGDEVTLRTLIKQCLGQEPDALLMTVLIDDLKRTGDEYPFAYFYAFLRSHRKRLRRSREYERVGELTKDLDRSIKMYGSVERALSGYGEPPHERKKREIPGAAYIEQATSPDCDLARRTAYALRKAGPERPDKPELVVVTDKPLHEDKDATFSEVETFIRDNYLDALIERARLSRQERQVVELFREGRTNQEIAQVLDIAENHVSAVKARAKKKLREAA